MLIPQDTYLVGTEGGYIHHCTVHYSSSSLLSFQAHFTPVRRGSTLSHPHNIIHRMILIISRAISWNWFLPSVFLTVATEMTLKIWRLGDTKPMFVYELHNQVGEQNII